jgi:ABC-type transport system involved in cytochrome c biogenesis permease subunit
MQILQSLLVVAHLLGMAGFIAAYFLQRRTAPQGRLIAMWAWCVLIITVSGFGLVVSGIITDTDHNPVKMIIKGVLMTLLGVTVLIVYFRRRPIPRQLPAVFTTAVLAEVLVSVLIT